MPKRGTNIYKRKDGRWEARYIKEILPNGKKKYGSVYAKSYAEAKVKQQQHIFEITKSIPKQCDITINELSDFWLKSIEKSVKILTLQKYTGILKNHILPFFGQILVTQITEKSITELSAKKLKDLSASTVNEMLIVLNEILSFAHKEYKISKPQVNMIREHKKEMKVLSKFEQQRLEIYLLSNMDIYKFGTFIALYTGIRIGELCALNKKDIKDGILSINKTMHRISTEKGSKVIIESPKSDSSIRKIPVSKFLNSMIEKNTNDGFFLQTKNGNFVEPRLLQQKFNKYSSDCGIEGATFHTLRHTFATRCIEAGFDIKTLSEILGHASVKTTLEKYVHSSFEQKQKCMELLRATACF